MKREIISAKQIVDYSNTKSASGFIADATGINSTYIYPTVIKVSDEDAFRLYKANEWLQSCVNRIVNDCCKVRPRVIMKDKNKKMSNAMQNRIALVKEFLANPNNNKESFRDIREKMIRDLLIYGRACLEKVLSPNTRRIIELYASISRSIELMTDEHGTMPDHRTYRQRSLRSGQFTYFDKDEMIFIVDVPTTETSYGLKRIDVLANTVATDILRSMYNSRFFLNGAEASGVISLEGMNKPELLKFRQYWQATHKGAKNAHKIAAVNVPIKYVRMALSNKDIEFSEYGREIRSKIFALYNMQPIIMGVSDPTTGKLNSEQQVQAYKDGALKPILDKESYAYTTEIVGEGFGYSDIMIDFNEVDLADSVTQSKIDAQDLMSAVLTINEVRARRELLPVAWGDTPLTVLPGGGQIDPITGRLIIPSKNPDNSDKKPAKKPKAFYKEFYGIKRKGR